MTTEEKARAYDEALERAKALRQEAIDKEYAIDYVKDYEAIFPELRESEDESTRKALIETVKCIYAGDTMFLSEQQRDRYLDWLEKQKESLHISETCKENPNSFTNEDERIRKFLVDYAIEMIAGLESDISLSTYDGIKGHDPEAEAELAQWQKARAYLEKQKEQKEIPLMGGDTDTYFDDLRITTKPLTSREWFDEGIKYAQRLQKEQKPAEWSEEDEDMLNSCISSIEEAKENRYAYRETDGDTSYDHEISWLKSLRPQPHWKPSEEQMKALEDAFRKDGSDEYRKTINSLYQDLKKL